MPLFLKKFRPVNFLYIPARTLFLALIFFVCLNSARAQTSFTNPAPITIFDSGASSVYPSNIPVSGMGTSITKVTVSLKGVSHTFPDDIGVLLVGPTGIKVRLMTDVGGQNDINNINLTFDDAATTSLPDGTTLSSGTYKPTQGTDNGGTLLYAHQTNFVSPAPIAPYVNTLSSFNGTNPNGTWKLFIDDDSSNDAGSMANGWVLTITALGPTASTININGQVLLPSGRGVSRALIYMTDQNGDSRVAMTNYLGYYNFKEVPSGETYIFNVLSKRHRFDTRVVVVMEDLEKLNFTASP